MSALMTTFTGKCVNPLDMRPEDICVRDIAHHLSLVNRFCGATYGAMSVAQHSVFVARMSETPLQGLLHDASEAYLGDVVKWVKSHESFQYYRTVESALQFMIFRKYSAFNRHGHLDQDDSVTEADRLVCQWEAHHQMKRMDTPEEHREQYQPLKGWDHERLERKCGRFQLWSAQNAEDEFLKMFRDLTEV